MRQITYTRLHGIITRGFCEVALGHEGVLFDGGHYAFQDAGWPETDIFGGLIQVSERGTDCTIKNLSVSGKWWGQGYTNLGASKDVLLENIEVTGACYSRLINVGSIADYSRNEGITLRNCRFSSLAYGDVADSGALNTTPSFNDPMTLTSYLINNPADVDRFILDNVELNAATNLSNTTNFSAGTTGLFNNITILNNSGTVYIDADNMYVGTITATGNIAGGRRYGTTVTANSGQLTNKANNINTRGKYQGLGVYSTTASQMVYAAGSATTDVWKDSNGTLVYTPV